MIAESNPALMHSSKNIEFINNKSLIESVNKKIQIYEDNNVSNYKAFVNIGGGSASLGYGLGKDQIKVGVIYPIEKKQIDYVDWVELIK